MAGFVAARNEVGVRELGTTVTVANNPTAKLMYYLSTVSGVLELDTPNLNRLSRHEQYYSLDDEDIDALLTLVCLFSPDELIGKVFFHSEDCGESNNTFYELSSVTHLMAVSNNVLIGGQRKRVAKVMFFERVWLEDNYFNPMRSFQGRLQRLARGLPGRAPSPPRYSTNTSQSCTIL